MRTLRKTFPRTWQNGTVITSEASDVSGLTSTQRILERAIQVIEESGEAAIRTNPIAFECGVTPPILYRAFGSREGLVIAAQAERYRRSTAEAIQFLLSYIEEATSRESLYQILSGTLDFVFSDARVGNRRLRAEVIGSSVSRAQLREELLRIDGEYATVIANAYKKAIENNWISKDKNHEVISLWVQGLINSRYLFDENPHLEYGTAWNELTRRAILDAIFD